MPKLQEASLLAFRDELSKLAVDPRVGSAAVLGTVGALGTGISRYNQAREEGQGRLQALGQGAKGALIGGAAGAGVGAAGARLMPGVGGAVSRFGQRQLHALTGWKPAAGLESIRAGAYNAQQRVFGAERAVGEAKGNFARADRLRDVGRAQQGLEAAQHVEKSNLTNIPGLVRGLASKPKETAKALWHEQTKGRSKADLAFNLGVPALGVAGALGQQTDPNKAQQSRAERIGGAVGAGVGGLATASMPIVGAAVAGEGFTRAGRAAGRLVGGRPKLVQNQWRPENDTTDLTRGPALSGSREVAMTPSAAGHAPERPA